MIEINNCSTTYQQNHNAFKELENINLEIAEARNVGSISSSGAKATFRHCKCSSEGTLILLPALLSQGLLKTKDF